MKTTRAPAKKAAAPAPTSPDGDGDRIAKVLARAGVASRRDIERMIAEGRIAVDGNILTTPAFKLRPNHKVTVDGRPVGEPEPTKLWRYHKPRGLVVSHRDEQGRPTVFEHMPPGMPRVVSVGRLDINSEGLLLLTNDGELARRLELPETGWLRKYRVRVFGRVLQADLDHLRDGVTVEGVRYGPINAEIDSTKGDNSWLTMGLREGKNREIKRVLGYMGLRVSRLIRVSFGPFELGKLEENQVEMVPEHAIREMIDGAGAGKRQARRRRAQRVAAQAKA